MTLNVTEVVWGSWGSIPFQNQTNAESYWLNKTTVIYYEKAEVPTLTVGSHVEVSGYYCMPLEDSLYSDRVVVSANMSEGYIIQK